MTTTIEFLRITNRLTNRMEKRSKGQKKKYSSYLNKSNQTVQDRKV